jgi:sec-independent protein translocase protein TatA
MHIQLALFNLGGWEIILISAVFLLLFGATRVPKLARGLGESIREFRKAGKEIAGDSAPDLDGSAPKRQSTQLSCKNEK